MRFSNCSCSATNDSVSFKAKQNHNHPRASSRTLRAASPVFSIQLCCCLAPCSSPRKPEHRRKLMKANSTLSHLALSHFRLFSALMQPSPHPAAKEFCICIHTLARSAHRRLCVFVGAALFRSRYHCHQQSNKQAQDVHLYRSHLATAFSAYSPGAGPSETFVDPRPR